jgi:hypothetical protein
MMRSTQSVLSWTLVTGLLLGLAGGCYSSQRTDTGSSTTAVTNGSSADSPGAQGQGEADDSQGRPDPVSGEASPPSRDSADVVSGTQRPAAGADETARSDERADATRTAQEEWFEDWNQPSLVLVLTGRQNGYLEPCGCTGLANQKGGLARRSTFLQQLRDELGWPVLPVDAGNQVRRYGRQAEIKFQVTTDALRKMGYAATTWGPDDLQLSIDELAATSASVDEADALFIAANVAIFDREFTPRVRVVEVGNQRVGITAILGDEARRQIQIDEVIHEAALESLRDVWEELASADCDYHVLLAQATMEETIALAQAVPHFDLVVTAGGSDEPSYEPEPIPDTKSLLVNVGAKGMFVGVVGLFDDPEVPWRYARVPMDARFPDARDMRELMANYQNELERLGFEQLGLTPLAHPSGRHFVGSSACGDCHTTAYSIWENTPHHHATQSIVDPYERNDVPRHFDPECVSCHVTGWNPQRYTPYESGYLSLTETPLLTGSGCENCHGPGSRHVAAEQGEIDADPATIRMLRREMQLPLAEAERKCLECHDLDNSPDFHEPGAFARYWEQIEHWGKD